MLLNVGMILRPHGIRGEVVVDVRTDEPDERFTVGTVLVTDTTVKRPSRPSPAGASDNGSAPTSGPAASPTARDAPSAVPGVRWQIPPTLTIEAVRPHQGRLLVTFAGVDDRNIAEELGGVLLCVDSAEVRPSDDPDEFHDHELVGLAAVTASGEPVGEVVRVDHAPASDLLVLRLPDGRTGLVPFVKAIVPEVDVAGGRVVLTPPEGLFDL